MKCYMTGKRQQLFLNIFLQEKRFRAIIDSSATGNFLDISITVGNQIGIIKKSVFYCLNVIDGKTIGIDKGLVTHKTN